MRLLSRGWRSASRGPKTDVPFLLPRQPVQCTSKHAFGPFRRLDYRLDRFPVDAGFVRVQCLLLHRQANQLGVQPGGKAIQA
jgi:hypothetical protein